MFRLKDSMEFGLAMTPTEDTADMFRQHMPQEWVCSAFSEEKIRNMVDMQRSRLKAHKTLPSVFLLLDDCMYDKAILKSLTMRDIFMNGRHMKITLCLSMQYLMDMGPELRSQVDYVFCLADHIHTNKQKLWKYFFGVFEKYSAFSSVMEKCTESHRALVMDATRVNEGDTIFWYKSSVDLPPFTIGSDAFVQATERRRHQPVERRNAPIPRSITRVVISE